MKKMAAAEGVVMKMLLCSAMIGLAGCTGVVVAVVVGDRARALGGCIVGATCACVVDYVDAAAVVGGVEEHGIVQAVDASASECAKAGEDSSAADAAEPKVQRVRQVGVWNHSHTLPGSGLGVGVCGVAAAVEPAGTTGRKMKRK